MSFKSILILLAAIAVMVCFIGAVIQAVSERHGKWKVLPYLIAMIPFFAYVYYHGPGIETALVAVLFLLLTKLIVYFAFREIGSPDQ